MLQALPADLGFLAEVLRRYPVRVLFRGEVLPEGPLRGERLWEESEIALYWEGPPPSQEVREALRLLLKVFREVLELRERELALLKSQEETSRLLGLLLHEIKNPLMSVLGALELTLEVEGLPEEAKELLSIAEKSARRIQDLLNKAREYLRLGQGVRLKSERVDLKALLLQVAEEMRPLARRKGIALRLILPKREAWVYGDREWLYQAVLNVVNNAIKYTPEGGRVAVRLLVGPEQYGIAVSDTGPGIPKEEQERVFEPFYRASTRGEVEGTGLGLALVKRVLEAHGGEVRLRSRLGQGSTFLLLLPRPRPGQRAPVGRLLLLMVALIALARLPIFPAPLGSKAFGEVPAGEVVRLPGLELAFSPEAKGEARRWRSLWGGGNRVQVSLEGGGVEAVRDKPLPLVLSTPEGQVRPTGTHLRLSREGGVRLSLYRGKVALGQETLPAGEGAVLGKGVRRKLLAAPVVRPVPGPEGEVVFRLLGPEGTRAFRVEVRSGEAVVLSAKVEGNLFRYLPQADRLSQVRAMALDEVGLEGYPSDPVPFRERRSFYEGRKRLPQDPAGAEAFLRRAVSAFPDDAEALGELAFALYLQGRHGEAKPLYEKALALLDSPDIRVRYARLLYHMKRYGEAEASYRLVLAGDPGNLDARWGLAEVVLALGRAKEAELLARQVLAMEPSYPLARFTLAKALLEQGRREEAKVLLREELRLRPHPEVAELLNRVLGTP
ncbi:MULTISPECIES: ATP-binding protein [Thermus]|uniref:histidine kinase n=1 Tax=Thermus scotoductus (strain ATCC 700910 / SA-01) TaxID=743525 RepID=E8PN67_THESS|nr:MULTISPECIES: ATP-binding protein [Thermus]ADW22601.1 signAl transduction histidine kinase containing a receiver domain [Thermus scotoductus SA-01]